MPLTSHGYEPPRPPCPLSPALRQAAKDPALRPSDLSLLIELHEHLDWYRSRNVKRTTLARILGRKQPHITSGVRRLVARGYVIEDERPEATDRRRRGLRLAMAAPEIAVEKAARIRIAA